MKITTFFLLLLVGAVYSQAKYKRPSIIDLTKTKFSVPENVTIKLKVNTDKRDNLSFKVPLFYKAISEKKKCHKFRPILKYKFSGSKTINIYKEIVVRKCHYELKSFDNGLISFFIKNENSSIANFSYNLVDGDTLPAYLNEDLYLTSSAPLSQFPKEGRYLSIGSDKYKNIQDTDFIEINFNLINYLKKD